MSYLSDLSQTNEYLSFRSSIPLRKIDVDSDDTKVNKLILVSFTIFSIQHYIINNYFVTYVLFMFN